MAQRSEQIHHKRCKVCERPTSRTEVLTISSYRNTDGNRELPPTCQCVITTWCGQSRWRRSELQGLHVEPWPENSWALASQSYLDPVLPDVDPRKKASDHAGTGPRMSPAVLAKMWK